MNSYAKKMKLEIIKSEGLAHNSYYLSDKQEAVIIDPRRDCEIYTQLAEKECTKIKYILETHRNEDYVVGSLELQNTTEGSIVLHEIIENERVYQIIYLFLKKAENVGLS